MASTTSLVPATEPIEPTVIKTDTLGRMRRTPQQRERILDEFERSGLSGGKFAELCGVKYQTFATWVQGRKHQRNGYRNGKPRRNTLTQVKWLEASVQPEATCTQGLRLQLPGGVQVEISHASHIPLVAALVRALAKPC